MMEQVESAEGSSWSSSSEAQTPRQPRLLAHQHLFAIQGTCLKKYVIRTSVDWGDTNQGARITLGTNTFQSSLLCQGWPEGPHEAPQVMLWLDLMISRVFYNQNDSVIVQMEDSAKTFPLPPAGLPPSPSPLKTDRGARPFSDHTKPQLSLQGCCWNGKQNKSVFVSCQPNKSADLQPPSS